MRNVASRSNKKDIAPDRFCSQCKHFIQPYLGNAEFGKCEKSAVVNLVDGSYKYSYASTTRDYECKGMWFEERKEDVAPIYEIGFPFYMALFYFTMITVILTSTGFMFLESRR